MSHNAFSSCWQDENPAFLSHRMEREREMHFQFTDENFNFCLLKIKDVKEKPYIKNLIFSWNCWWVFLALFTSFYHSFWGKEREEMSVIHDFDSTSYTINFSLFLQFLIHKAALWHHSCALVWKRKEKTADTACSLPMAPGATCFPITEAEQKIELKW